MNTTILQREKYKEKIYLSLLLEKKPSCFKLVQLLSTHNVKELNNLGKYLHLADKICTS